MQRLSLLPTGTASLIATDGEHVTLACDRAFPPGSSLQAHLEPDGEALQVKVTGCHRAGADFNVRGRFVGLSRAIRDKLLGASATPPA